MTLEELFSKGENGTLTYEQASKIASENNAKFFDLSEGDYVSKNKYEDDLKAKESIIETLNGTIATRDKDLEEVQKQLEAAGTDDAKLSELNTQLSDLQSKYDTDTKNYQAQLSQQAYEFGVKEFAATKKFTSNAAKRDFIQSMINKKLTMDNDKILGAEDFVSAYTTDNPDAFVVEQPQNTNPEPAKPLPQFVEPSGNPNAGGTDKNAFSFSFTGVRPQNVK